MTRIWFITGTSTGVGKTVLAVWLTRHLRARGRRVRALKPLSSGGRDDAEALAAAQQHEIPVETLNPWSFRSPVTPLLAARRERRWVSLEEVVEFVRTQARGQDDVVVEGAGGVLSPLGEGFASRELIRALRARVVVVGLNALGVLNAVRLTVECLPRSSAKGCQVVLMDPPNPDASASANAALLSELLGTTPVHRLRWAAETQGLRRDRATVRVLDALTAVD